MEVIQVEEVEEEEKEEDKGREKVEDKDREVTERGKGGGEEHERKEMEV